MKKILLLLLVIGCSSKKTEVEKLENKAEYVVVSKPEVKTPIPIKEKLFGDKRDSTSLPEFLRLFKPVEFDTLHIFSQENHSIRNGQEMQIGGVDIPAKFSTYLPNYIKDNDENPWRSRACFRFSYSPDLTALIVNSISSTGMTMYSILLYSDKQNKVIYSKPIADNMADEGYGQAFDAWLLNLNNDKFVDILTKGITHEPDETNPNNIKIIYKPMPDSIYLGESKGFKYIKNKSYSIKGFKVHDTDKY